MVASKMIVPTVIMTSRGHVVQYMVLTDQLGVWIFL